MLPPFIQYSRSAVSGSVGKNLKQKKANLTTSRRTLHYERRRFPFPVQKHYSQPSPKDVYAVGRSYIWEKIESGVKNFF